MQGVQGAPGRRGTRPTTVTGHSSAALGLGPHSLMPGWIPAKPCSPCAQPQLPENSRSPLLSPCRIFRLFTEELLAGPGETALVCRLGLLRDLHDTVFHKSTGICPAQGLLGDLRDWDMPLAGLSEARHHVRTETSSGHGSLEWPTAGEDQG